MRATPSRGITPPKGRPTPSRAQAEDARMARITKTKLQDPNVRSLDELWTGSAENLTGIGEKVVRSIGINPRRFLGRIGQTAGHGRRRPSKVKR